ncbi:UL16-binding protein 3 isoform X2 [Saccopteryx bilineata]
MTAPAKCSRVFLLLLLLLSCVRAAPRRKFGAGTSEKDYFSLSLKFSITTKLSSGQSWCKEIQVNGTTLNCICSRKKVECPDPLGMQGNATEALESMIETVNDPMEELVKTLLESKTIGVHSLQGEMRCEKEANGNSAFWIFVIKGKESLHFDSKTRNFAEFNDEGRKLKEILENNTYLTHLFVTSAAGDCVKVLRVLGSQNETLDTKDTATTATGTATPATASNTAVPTIASAQFKNLIVTFFTQKFPPIVTCMIIVGILLGPYIKGCCCC